MYNEDNKVMCPECGQPDDDCVCDEEDDSDDY